MKSFLKAGCCGHRISGRAVSPAPRKGGILSPLLANIALSVLDDHFTQQWQTSMAIEQQRQKRRRHGLANYRLIRLANIALSVLDDISPDCGRRQSASRADRPADAATDSRTTAWSATRTYAARGISRLMPRPWLCRVRCGRRLVARELG